MRNDVVRSKQPDTLTCDCLEAVSRARGGPAWEPEGPTRARMSDAPLPEAAERASYSTPQLPPTERIANGVVDARTCWPGEAVTPTAGTSKRQRCAQCAEHIVCVGGVLCAARLLRGRLPGIPPDENLTGPAGSIAELDLVVQDHTLVRLAPVEDLVGRGVQQEVWWAHEGLVPVHSELFHLHVPRCEAYNSCTVPEREEWQLHQHERALEEREKTSGADTSTNPK